MLPLAKAGQGRSIVVVFLAPGRTEPALAHQGQEVVEGLTGITGIMQTLGGFVGEMVALVQFTEQQASGIRGYAATGKISQDRLEEKDFKAGRLLPLGIPPEKLSVWLLQYFG